MNFSTAKTTAMGLLLAGLAIGVAGYFGLSQGTSSYNFTVILASLCLVVALVIIFIWCRCPKCGKRIVYQVFKYTKCPKCGAALVPVKKKTKKSTTLK